MYYEQSKSVGWFLYDRHLLHEKVNDFISTKEHDNKNIDFWTVTQTIPVIDISQIC